jgi:GTP-binding protein
VQIRNVAIIAHVDHGKTTLVDAMLRQAGAFRAGAETEERILDSMDLERERGITILSKATAIPYGDVTINLVDTPGHADFGGEVERALYLADGALLLVDAAEGPLPQTRFVLAKALARGLRIIVVVNKVDRQDARPREVLDEVLELLLELGGEEVDLDVPVVWASGRAGRADLDLPLEAHDLRVLFEAIIKHVPPPVADIEGPLRAQVLNLDAAAYLGRLALVRVHSGMLRRGQQVARIGVDGSVRPLRVGELYRMRFLEREAAESVAAGDIAIVAGVEDIAIGESLCDPEDPHPLPPIYVDEPAIAMTFAVNTSPLAGRDGTKLTARLLAQRLAQETVGNVSIRVLPTERTDSFEVQGRGELALGVLIELMRREGFELTISKPRVLTRVERGQVLEPFERLEIEVPDDLFGALTQVLSPRRAELVAMEQRASGWIHAVFRIPARGLLGARGELLTQTRGQAVIHHSADGYGPWAGPLRARAAGSLVADRSGVATTYALLSLQERGTLLIGPGDEVYEGMVIGLNARPGDMDVNPTRERKVTNMRSSTAEELVRLSPPRRLTLDAALELIDDDECVEVTPRSVRVRKVVLSARERAKARRSGDVGGT